MAFPLPTDFMVQGPQVTGDGYRRAVDAAFAKLPKFTAPEKVPSLKEAFGGAAVLIVGAGVVARALADRVAELNPGELHLLVPAGSESFGPKSAKVHPFNISSQITRIETLPESCNYVFNAHELVADWCNPKQFIEENTDVARAVFKVCVGYRDNGSLRRLVHISTGEVYGYLTNPPPESQMPADEGVPWVSAKIIAELALAKQIEAGLPVTILRPGAVYGSGNDGEVAEAVKRMEKGWNILIAGGSKDPGLTHATDLAEAVLLAAAAPHALGQVYNITGDSRTTWKDFYDEIANVLGTPMPWISIWGFFAFWFAWFFDFVYSMLGMYKRQPPLTMRRMMRELADADFPSHRAKRELGYRPTMDWRTGVTEAAAAIKLRREGGRNKKRQ